MLGVITAFRRLSHAPALFLAALMIVISAPQSAWAPTSNSTIYDG
ncbi:MAG: hypothetical protein AAGE89_11620 [Pseudomonadota bacterium]